MKIQGLQFTADHKEGNPFRVEIELSELRDFRKQGTELPIAYLISKDMFPRLREELAGALLDCGIKKPAIELGRCFRKATTDKLQLLEAGYTASGSAKKSISTFLSKSAEFLNVYIIGTTRDIFDDLWRDGSDPTVADPPEGGKSPSSYTGPREEGADESICELYEDLLKRCTVPKTLEEAYVGESWKADLVRRLIVLASRRESPVLIMGDTGTGKEIVAEQIHRLYKENKNKAGDEVRVNCATIPSELLEMELFGVEPDSGIANGPRGKPKIGLWELANEGTLFLDEVGDIAPRHQVKILRALESGMIRRVGGTKEIPVTARIVAATNRPLPMMVQQGRFREDLYYRLRGFMIYTPALKDHPDDIPFLADFFWKKISEQEGKDGAPANKPLPQEIKEELKKYRWPANAREIRSVLVRLECLCDDGDRTLKDLRVAMNMEGQYWITQGMETAERSIDVLRADCWLHLKRVDDVIRTTKADIKPLISKNNADLRNAADEVLRNLEYHQGELKLLCKEHFLFHSPETFAAVTRFAEHLTKCHDFLHESPSQAKAYWQETLGEELETVLMVIFREGERVLG